MIRFFFVILAFLILVFSFVFCAFLYRCRPWRAFSICFFVAVTAIIILPEWYADNEWQKLCRLSGLIVYQRNQVDGFYDRRNIMPERTAHEYLKAGYKFVEVDSSDLVEGRYKRYELVGGELRHTYSSEMKSEYVVEYNEFRDSQVDGAEYKIFRSSDDEVVGTYRVYYLRGGFLYRYLTKDSRDPSPLGYCDFEGGSSDYILQVIPPRN
ncbi:hypothetical protein [Pseudomonas lijiangensis]|uniref:SMODS-associating 2TM beta-strand rich effector domain-containing protein n=2 Tax=Pseudomonas TaxID=286 RepID=A0ABX8HQS8_9PSED|nr:hypothetical protein [Pseudomonas lijiangensis]MBX8500272.1 hypothetical protein [Pseudomonas lijiangensis]MBX8505524.1 hypothetical protein [Pseudomonas lijiangensis]QWU82400.1 hypothetical protein KQP88_20550 [Pseudomonas lijiangensis]